MQSNYLEVLAKVFPMGCFLAGVVVRGLGRAGTEGEEEEEEEGLEGWIKRLA